ncbi:YceI family protein [Fulvivirga sp. 29W222]|uniref:YceI family protein n=1 Tax=Fulvivirga marina TaxID=2494733 RepID=A0A937G1S3_9BACT|nr:YceI family protein [Fulvivirga marina]MBL6449022.1 YceI family protein [Fulvivirga marina]
MNPRIKLLIVIFGLSITAYGQKYKSFESKVRFFSEATLENIAADNKDGSSVFDEESKQIVFSIPITSFEFKKSLMQEHFNENYMESEKYPKAIFKGEVINYEEGKATQKVTAKGDITIHGITRAINVDGEMEYKDGKLYLKSVFPVRLEDYKVKIPQVLWQNIAEEVEVTINFIYKPI